jgi:hypothetical protein
MAKRISIFDFLRSKHLTWVGEFSPSFDFGATVDHFIVLRSYFARDIIVQSEATEKRHSYRLLAVRWCTNFIIVNRIAKNWISTELMMLPTVVFLLTIFWWQQIHGIWVSRLIYCVEWKIRLKMKLFIAHRAHHGLIFLISLGI